MSLGYADVEYPVGHLGLHCGYRRARRHGGRDGHYAVVGPRQFEQSVAENVLIFERGAGFGAFALARSGVESAGSVP